MKFSIFSNIDLHNPDSIELKSGWKVNYLCFSLDKYTNEGIAPLVILGGAFQKFHSFKKEVEVLCQDMPVILVDLPGQGSNDQLGEELNFEDYATILRDFLDYHQIQKIVPVALSYGSAIGFTFAAHYPERTHRLILGGTTPKLRKSVRILLEESIQAMNEGRMKDFSTGVILNLFNYSQRRRTKVPRLLIRGFHKSLISLTEEDKLRYLVNTTRLLNLNGLGEKAPQCETLIIAGEYDNFTTPSECLEVANRCEKRIVGILRNCDHLAPFVKKELMINTYRNFSLHGKLEENEGISSYTETDIPLEKKILEPRWTYQGEVKLKCPQNTWEHYVNVINLNSYGLCVDIGDKLISQEKLQNSKIEFVSEGFELDTIFFDSTRDGIRGIFKRYDFDTYDKLEKFTERLGQNSCIFQPISL
ncbi:MAG: hypothetical protein CME60_09560 [Halobacteriovoraceae bacterium]|nr:hypothetical protein [Halobacteriovoraceae bacterium]|tara:strand:- start:853 stop:2106 length:1254 start_codon:yes stop_codon:yes gene_type:complete